MLMDGGVLSGGQRGGGSVEGAGVVSTPAARRGSKALWFGIWGAMGMLACASALAPYWILSGRSGFEFGIFLVIAATVQLARGVCFCREGSLF